MSDDGEEIVVVGSKQELEELSGQTLTDLHRHFIDDITIPSRQVCGGLVFLCVYWYCAGVGVVACV